MSTRTSGIYAIRNISTEKTYVGQAVDIPKRWNEHKRKLNVEVHHNLPLQNSWNKHGEPAFEFIILEDIPQDTLSTEEFKTLLTQREQFHMDQYEDKYNICPVASSPLGVTRSAETRAKMSSAGKEKVFTEEHKANLSVALIGNTNTLGLKHTDDAKAKISAAKIGTNNSDDARAKLSVALMGNTNALGFKHTDETRAKYSAAKTGTKHSEETKAKMSEAQTGKKHTEATKAKMSAARKKYWSDKKNQSPSAS